MLLWYHGREWNGYRNKSQHTQICDLSITSPALSPLSYLRSRSHCPVFLHVCRECVCVCVCVRACVRGVCACVRECGYVRVAGYSFSYVCYYACFQGRSVAKTVPSVSRTAGSAMAWVTAMICLTRATAVSNCLSRYK